MRLIGLAVVLAASLVLAPLVAEAQRVPEVGVLVFGTERLGLNTERGVRELRDALRGFGWIKMEPWELVIALQKKRRASGSWIAREPGSGGRSLSPRNRAGPGLGLAPWPHHREAAGSP